MSIVFVINYNILIVLLNENEFLNFDILLVISNFHGFVIIRGIMGLLMQYLNNNTQLWGNPAAMLPLLQFKVHFPVN